MLSRGAFDATFEDLVGLVKASRRHNLLGKSGTWEEFLKKQGQRGTLDPQRHSRDVLEAYVYDLIGVGLEGAAPSSAAVPARTTSSAKDFVERYLKWSKKVRKDTAKGRGVPPGDPAYADGADSQQHPQQQPEADLYTQRVSVWSLIRRTQAHPKFEAHYSHLPSYYSGWTRIKRARLSADVRPRLLALDCEMCATDEDESALLGVCVVDEFGEVLYRNIVRPEGQIQDLRTALTGVTEADLVNIKVTAKDAQRAVCKLLEGDGSNGRPVVLVGHALYHDLMALRLDHQPVIDTSLIFSYRNLPSCIPGLKDLARAVLGVEMRKRAGGAHDSMEDAAVAMRLVMRELQMAAPSPPLEPPQVKVPATELAKLMAHALPEGMGPVDVEQALKAALTAAGAPTFERVEVFPDKAKQVLLVFAKPSVANEGFKKLPGKMEKDSLGRYFKEVSLGSGKRCKVRKMACHNGMAFGSVDASTKPAPKRPAKRTRSTERSVGREVGADGEDSTGVATQQGFGRKVKRQKRGHGGDEDPLKAAGGRRREDGAAAASQPGTTTAAAAAAAAAATAPVPVAMGVGASARPAEIASVAAAAESDDQKPRTKTKRQNRGDGENGQATQHAPIATTSAVPIANGTAVPAYSSHAPPTAADRGEKAKSGREDKERKRKRDKDAEGKENDGGVAEGKEEGTAKKARKDAR